VRDVRHWFRDRRVSLSASGFPRLITHGWSWRNQGVAWGWSAPVSLLRMDKSLPERACYFLKAGPFTTSYAYPRPGTDLYNAGGGSSVHLDTARVRPGTEAQVAFLKW
jgi:hypothetical protein